MDRRGARWRNWLTVVFWLIVLTGLGLLGAVPPPAVGVDAPSGVFSADRALITLADLLDDVGPHATGTPEAADVRSRILDELEALGYEPEVDRATSCRRRACADINNVFAVRPGTKPDAPLVLVSTHYDSVPAGPGASDAGAAVAGMLELARLLREHPTESGVAFLFNEGEESGLLGVADFVETERAAEVGAVVNLEARGTAGRVFLFETSGSTSSMIGAYASEAARPSVSTAFTTVYEQLASDTDLTVFAENGVPGINLAFIDNAYLYHSSLDNLDNLDPRSVQDLGDQALAAVLGLANGEVAAPSDGEVVAFDVVGRFVISWSAGLTIPIALVVLVWVALLVGLLVRADLTTLPSVLLGVAAMVVATVGVALVGFGVEQGLLRLGASWHATVWPFRLAIVAVAIIGVVLLGSEAGRRVGAVSIWAGCVGVFALAGVGLAFTLTGGSYLALVPTVVPLVAMTVALAIRGSAGAVTWAMRVAPLGGLVLIQVAVSLETALGASALSIGLPYFLSFVLLGPLLNDVPRLAFPGLLAAAAVAMSVVALVVPGRSESVPEAMELAHFQSDGQAWWRAENRSWPRRGELPESWSDLGWELVADGPVVRYWAEAEASGRPDPSVEVLERGEKNLLVKLTSGRSAFAMVLTVPPGTSAISVNGEPLDQVPSWVTFHGPGPVEVAMVFEGAVPDTLSIVDRSAEPAPDPLPWPADFVPYQRGIFTERSVEVDVSTEASR